ncbi:MAG: MMPL family transporter, partial [Planctomycetaceae bacterium]|nr:MMPL family transporter [Planctomycetaceae bacterium]
RDDPRLKNYLEDKRLFGGAETTLVAYTDPELLTAVGLERLEHLDSRLRELPGVAGVLSLAQARLPGSPLDARSLREHLSAGTLSEGGLRAEVLACDLFRGRFLSADGETAVLFVSLAPDGDEGASRPETIEQIRAMCDSHEPPAVLAGGPVLVEDVYRHLERDGRTLGIASSLVLAAVIALLFRSLRWILLPLAVVHVTLIWTKALLVVSGLQLSMVSSPLVALVTVIGVATVIHVAIRFREERDRHIPTDALRETLTHIGPAVFWTCLTTAAGFSSLLASRIVPVGGFGTMMALGSLLVFVATMGLLPAGILLGRFHTDLARAPGERKVAAVLDGMVAAVETHPRKVAVMGLGLLCMTSLGIFRLQVATDFDENFRQSSPIVQSYRFLSERIGTTSIHDVLIDGPDLDNRDEFNDFLKRMQDLQRDLNELSGVKGNLSTVNVLDFVMGTRKERAGFMELMASTSLEAVSPAERLETLQLLQPDLISGFWNREQNVFRIVVQTGQITGAKAKRELIETIEARARERFPTARTAGVDILLTYMVESLLTDQWITFSLAIAAILVMMMIAFRDWQLGLIALIPNAAPILIVVGVMGWAGLKINMATAMLASVSMGLAVDFSIHYLYRFRHELRAGKDVGEALRDAHGSVGLAMVLANVALIAGFSTLTISAFIPTVHFGILVSVAMAGGLAGNLIALPLLLRLYHR